MRNIKIYQIPYEKLRDVNYSFMSWEYAKDKFSINDYKVVAEWNGDFNDSIDKYLETIYELGNKGTIQKLINYKMRSISMSDIVEVDGSRWYCDTFGWTWIGTFRELKK